MRRPRRIYRMSKIKESKNLQNVKNKRIEEFTDCQKQKNRRIYRLSKIKESKNLQNVKNKKIEEFTDCQKQKNRRIYRLSKTKKSKNLQNLKYHHEGLILTLVSSIYCSILAMVSSSSSTCTFSSCISTLGSFLVVFFPRFGVDIFLCGIFYF